MASTYAEAWYWRTLSRSYGRCFAEFLNKGSPVHLGLLDLSTCVGFGTDTFIKDRSFSWKLDLPELSRPKEGVSTILALKVFRIYLENKTNNN